jgi:hypothetical protein
VFIDAADVSKRGIRFTYIDLKITVSEKEITFIDVSGLHGACVVPIQ